MLSVDTDRSNKHLEVQPEAITVYHELFTFKDRVSVRNSLFILCKYQLKAVSA